MTSLDYNRTMYSPSLDAQDALASPNASDALDWQLSPDSAPSQPKARGRRARVWQGEITEKTFVCPVENCLKVFGRNEHLLRHMRMHTGEKPFSCDFPGCNRSFTRSDNLNAHMLRTHGKEKGFATSAGKAPKTKLSQKPRLSIDTASAETVSQTRSFLKTPETAFAFRQTQESPLSHFISPPEQFLDNLSPANQFLGLISTGLESALDQTFLEMNTPVISPATAPILNSTLPNSQSLLQMLSPPAARKSILKCDSVLFDTVPMLNPFSPESPLNPSDLDIFNDL